MGEAESKPWREIPWGENSTQQKYVKSYHPHNRHVNHLRILLHGPVGAGKSSFINSVTSALHGRISVTALTDATSGDSFTRNYKTYKIRKENEAGAVYPLVFNDIMGLEESVNRGVCVEDIKLAMMGHVKDGYEFKYGSKLTEDNQDYNKQPTLNDKVHVLACVVPVD
ncbi:hypothetical protein LDENG_00298280, partial [Lucifuga dentata]